MSTDYKVRVKNTSGVIQAEFSDFEDLAYRKVVNGIGYTIINLRSDHDAVQYFTDKAITEVWRRNESQGIDWTMDFRTLFRDEKRSYVDQKKRFVATCEGPNSMLDWRIVDYFANQTNLSTFSSKKAEYIAKRLVDYNCGPNATTGNGRNRPGSISNFVVEADGGFGNTLDWNCMGKPVLGELQKLALVGGGDFDVTLTGTNSWEFKWYNGQLGTDRTNSVLFSLDRGNMANPVYEKVRSSEKTIACVYGAGEEDARDYLNVTGTNYSSTNDMEIYVDARTITEGGTNYYQSKGEEALQKKKAIDKFEFDVLQTPASRYGKHYFLGDIVTAEFDTISVAPKIVGIMVKFSNQKEDITVEIDTRYG